MGRFLEQCRPTALQGDGMFWTCPTHCIHHHHHHMQLLSTENVAGVAKSLSFKKIRFFFSQRGGGGAEGEEERAPSGLSETSRAWGS